MRGSICKSFMCQEYSTHYIFLADKYIYITIISGASLIAQLVKNLPAMLKTLV